MLTPPTPILDAASEPGVLGGVTSGVDRAFARGLWWYDLVDDARTPYSELENNYGLTLDDLTPKPAYAAFRAQAAH